MSLSDCNRCSSVLSKERYLTEVSVQPEAQTVSSLFVSGAYIA